MNHQPFSVSCVLPFGIAAVRLEELSLDGILTFALCQQVKGEEFWEPGHPLIHPDLPLARREFGEHWYWSISVAQGKAETRDLHYWHRRFDEQFSDYIDFGGRRGKIVTEGGPMRDMRSPQQILYPHRLTWYALGDPVAVWDLLQGIHYIGKQIDMGEGEVWWEAPVVLDRDRSVWDDDRLMRPVPAEEVGGHGGFDYEYRALRPPYWEPSSQTLCAVRNAG